MSGDILSELYEAKIDKQNAEEEAENRRERENTQRIWEAGELRRTVVEPGIEVAHRLDRTLGKIGCEESEVFFQVDNYRNPKQSIDDYFEFYRKNQASFLATASVLTKSLVVNLGELDTGEQGIQRAGAQLSTQHLQLYSGTPTKVSRIKSKREYEIVPTRGPELWSASLAVSTLEEDGEGDLLEDTLYVEPLRIFAAQNNQVLANETTLNEFRGQESRIAVMGSVLALIQKRIDENPANILPPSNEFAHMPGSWHLSEC